MIAKSMIMLFLNRLQRQLIPIFILKIINDYTKESGVRQLERVIGTCARKAVLAILKNNKKSIYLINLFRQANLTHS